MSAEENERKPRRPKFWELTTTGAITVCLIIFTARIADHYMRASNRLIADAKSVAQVASVEKIAAKTEAEEAKAKAEKTRIESDQTVDKVITAYESESQPHPARQSYRGYLHLGICKSHWVKPFFSDLPPCSEGKLDPPVMIRSLLGVSLRSRPPGPKGIGPEVNRIRTGGVIRLLRILSITPSDPNALQIYWGEIEIPTPADPQSPQSPKHDP